MGYIGSDPKTNESVSTAQLVDDSVTNAKIVDNVLFTSVTSSVVSASSTITADTFTGTFSGALSSSAQIGTDISGSFTNLSSSVASDIATNLSSITNNSSSIASDIATNLSSITTLKGSGTTQGVGTSDSPTFNNITATGTVTAQEFHSEFVSASIAFTSGSHKFGDSADDIHQMTGSLRITGSGNHYIQTGNLGIGTNNPGRLLDIENSSAGGSTLVSIVSATDGNCQLLFGDTSSDTRGKVLYNNVGEYMSLEAGGSEIMRISGSGNVGIGTASPGAVLHVTASSASTPGVYFSRSNETDNNTEALKVENRGTKGIGLHVYSDAASAANALVQIHADNSGFGMPALRVIQDGSGDAAWFTGGNVGIGTTGPDMIGYGSGRGLLTIASTASGKYSVIELSGYQTSGDQIIGDIGFYNTSNGSTINARALIRANTDGAVAASELTFHTSTTTSATQKMVIKNDGKVGIGTDNPANKLHVSDAGQNTVMRIGNNGNYDQYIYFNGGNDWCVGMDYSDSNKFKISGHSSFDGTDDFLTIDTSGNTTFAGNDSYFGNTSNRCGLELKSSQWNEIFFTNTSLTRATRIGMAYYSESGYGVVNGDFYVYSPSSGDMDLIVKYGGGVTLCHEGSTTTIGGNATFAGDISMTGSQKKMTLANSSTNCSSMLRISSKSSVTPSWADEYICELHGSSTGTDGEVLLFLHQHENSSDRPILRAMNGDDTTQIEFGSNQQYKFRGEMCIGDGIHTPVAPLMVKAPGIDGAGLARLESTSSTSNPEGLFVYYPNNSTTSGWAFYQHNSSEGKSMIHNSGDFDSRTNSYGGWSDERIKTDIRDANSQWDDIKNIRIRNFKYKSTVAEYGNDAPTFLGAVAQEVESISPSLVEEIIPSKYEIEECGFGEQNEDGEWIVKKDENGKDMTVKTMKYSILYMKAIKCLQEAMEKIETLEAKVEALENA